MEDVRAGREQHWVAQVRRHAREKPTAPAIRFAGVTTTWGEFGVRVASLAAALARRGVARGDRVALVMHNRPEFLETMLAVNTLGALAVPVNFRLAPAEVGSLLADCTPALAVVDEANVGLVASVPAERLVVVGGARDGYADLLAEPVGGIDWPVLSAESPALVMYTSGTTGRPKGAVLSHQNLQAQALTIIRAWRLFDDDEVTLCAVPLFHAGALGLVAPLLAIGGCLVIAPSAQFSAAGTLDLLESERVNSVFLVPTQWQALCDDPSRAERDLSSLRVTCWGAAPASTTLLRRIDECFPGAINVATFGQTEMSPVTCVLTGQDAQRKIGSVGRPVAGVSARVVDAAGEDVVPGEVGEIVYRGPGMMLGYWHNPEADEIAFAGGWFHSGDLVRVDPDGYVYVVDRLKDMIISGGENVYCAEVEDVLAAHPDIADVSVVGAPHPRWGETPVAFVVPRPGRDAPDLVELTRWSSTRLARYKIPTAVSVLDALPRNASGKVAKDQLRRLDIRVG